MISHHCGGKERKKLNVAGITIYADLAVLGVGTVAVLMEVAISSLIFGV